MVNIGQGFTARDTGAFIPTVLHEGDKVLFGASAGMPLDIPDEDGKNVEHRLLREGDILILISESEAK